MNGCTQYNTAQQEESAVLAVGQTETRRSARKKTPVVQFCSQPEYLPAGFQSKARGRSHGLMDSIDEGDEAPQKRARTDEDLA
jgi:hypothetical protein